MLCPGLVPARQTDHEVRRIPGSTRCLPTAAVTERHNCGSRRSAGTIQHALGQESLMRCPERLAPGWCAAVHGGVDQYLLDLLDRYACGDRALHIDAQLVGPPKRRQDREIQHAPAASLLTRRR